MNTPSTNAVHVFVCFIQSQPSLKWMPLQIWNADDFFFQEGKGSDVYCSLPGEGGGGGSEECIR